MREHLHAFLKLEFPRVREYIGRYTQSAPGREHAERLSPSADAAGIRRSLALVSEMKRLLETDDPLPCEHLFDIRTAVQRSSIDNYALEPADLRRIGLVERTARELRAFMARRAAAYPLLAALCAPIVPDKLLEFNISQAIGDDGEVREGASRELAGLRRQISGQARALRDRLDSILRTAAGKEWAQEEIITTREGRMVIPVKVEHKNHVPGFIHSASSSGATVFIEPMETLELNNELRTLRFAEQRELDRILKELTRQVSAVREAILENVRILGETDFIQAKAKYSIEILGAEPRLRSDALLRLRGGRHPILLARHAGSVVPLDLDLGGSTTTLVITGPNAGGKSVAMKTVGLLTLLAQSGCHIPASPDSEIPVCRGIFVELGDEQSIENDLSSFSSHLVNLRAVTAEAGEGDLVLIDEICSGTDPSEGSSLAAAILERLTAAGSLNIVTTHHGMLKTFAFEAPHTQNGAMEFDQGTLTPTYRFKAGIPGSSYAIEMAERLMLPPDVIARSKEMKGADAAAIEKLIADLERKAFDLRRSLDEATREEERLKGLTSLYETRITTLQKELKAIRGQALDEARAIVGKANAIVENSVREIRQNAATKEVVRKVKEEIRSIIQELEAKGDPPPTEEFHVGDKVRLRESDVGGEIEAALDDGRYLVRTGTLKARVGSADITHENPRSGAPASAVPPQHQRREWEETREVRREIDLRGMYGDEAIAAVDKFLDDALLAGLHRVDIIHGKGTGALRKKIAEHLGRTPSVKSFRLGEWNEGGSGVTVVEL